MRPRHRENTNAGLAIFVVALFIVYPVSSYGIPMTNDPNGFHDITWGSALESRPDMAVTRRGPHVVEYELKGMVPSFADIPVESVRLSAVDEQFARVMIRYHGEETHKRILAYLERKFGAIERIPGQMMRGLNQQYNWRGPDSEINLTYQASTERGFIFMDSRTLAPRFNDNIADSAE